jgi:hypothetical protein
MDVVREHAREHGRIHRLDQMRIDTAFAACSLLIPGVNALLQSDTALLQRVSILVRDARRMIHDDLGDP